MTVWESAALDTDPAHPLIQLLLRNGSRLAGAPWFCDAAVFAEAGIPAVAAGPGYIAQAHTNDEWIAVAELELGVEFYRRFLEAL
jgi:acetylornithine deacetylase/succinyl-diaminopimelate desuccinylase-like protein